MTVTVRRATIQDASDYRTIRLAALANAPEAFGTTYAEVAGESHGYWVRRVREAACLVLAYDESRVIGTASGGDFMSATGRSHGLYGMYVEPDHQGCGVADRIIREIAHWAHVDGGSALYLHVTEGNLRAEAFYRRIGFTHTGRWEVMPRKRSVRLFEMVVTLPLEYEH